MMKHEIVREEESPAETMELVVTQKSIGYLETNIRRLELLVDKKLEDYKPESYMGDADLAKKDRAELNNGRKAIQRARINLIEELMKPYVEFEDRCKAVERKIDAASKALDEIVKAREIDEKDRKRKQIETFWATKEFDLFPLEKIFNSKWLNKTFKESDILSEMDAVIDRTYKDLKNCERYAAMYSLDAETVKAHYLMSLDVEETISYCDELQRQKEIAAKEKSERDEREHRKAIEIQRRESVREAIDAERESRISEIVDAAIGEPVEPKEPSRKEYVITVKCLDDELLKLKAAMNALGVEFSVEELEF